MSRMRRRILVLSSIFAAAAMAGEAAAQIPLAPRALGMGGAYLASARGFESVLFNPANLALADGPDWSVALPQVTVGSSVLGPRVSDLPDFLDYGGLDDARRQELLASIPANGTAVDVVMRAPVAAVQVGTIGVAASYAWLGEHTVGKDLVELFFEGYEQGRTDYQVGNTVGTRASFWDIAAGYAQNVGPITIGVTGHYYMNGTLMRSRAFDPDYDLLNQTASVDYVGVYSENGRGYGVDIGAALQPMQGLTLSAALANVVTKFDWSDELMGRYITLTEQDFQNGDFTAIEDRWSFSKEEIGANPTGRYGEVAAALDRDAWTVPTVLKLGAAWQPLWGTEIGVAMHTSRAEEGVGRLAGRWDGLFGVGIQQEIPFVTVRAGASTNLDDGSMVGAGLKLGVLDLAVAKFRTPGGVDEADRDGWAASMSVNVRTHGTLR